MDLDSSRVKKRSFVIHVMEPNPPFHILFICRTLFFIISIICSLSLSTSDPFLISFPTSFPYCKRVNINVKNLVLNFFCNFFPKQRLKSGKESSCYWSIIECISQLHIIPITTCSFRDQMVYISKFFPCLYWCKCIHIHNTWHMDWILDFNLNSEYISY